MPWPLTGRTPELDAAVAALRRCDSRGVVLAGGAGVGKTRLAREILARVTDRRTTIRWIGATASSAAVPLGCLAHLIPGTGTADLPGVLDRVARELHPPGRTGRTVVAVDDAHLLDAVSAGVVNQLALHHGVALVVTLRTGEAAPDAVTALWTDGHLDRLDLEPLARPETTSLLESVLEGPVEASSIRRLWRVTAGNPLYLQHLVEGERAAGNLQAVGGVWRWRGDPALRPQLVELVEARIGSLPSAVGRVLELLAYREPLDPGLLAVLAGRDAVEAAEDRGLVIVRVSGSSHETVLGHPLYAEVVRARTGLLRARRLRGELVGALADTPVSTRLASRCSRSTATCLPSPRCSPVPRSRPAPTST